MKSKGQGARSKGWGQALFTDTPPHSPPYQAGDKGGGRIGTVPAGTGEKGVTLLELIVTLAILGILASVIMPLSRMTVKRAKELELRRDLRIIRTAIDDYKKAHDEGRIRQELGGAGYPKSLSLLVEGADDIKSPKAGAKIRFMRRIPRDPTNPDKTVSPEQSWGLRSYDSDPDDPKEGEDVYDVYSKSEEMGLDGTPYKEW